jgi:type IV pilus biogenesis protein CpaD/CtpE
MPGVRHGDRALGRALLALVVLSLVGCGSGDEEAAGASTASASTQRTLIIPDTAGEWSRVTTDAANSATRPAEPVTTVCTGEE